MDVFPTPPFLFRSVTVRGTCESSVVPVFAANITTTPYRLFAANISNRKGLDSVLGMGNRGGAGGVSTFDQIDIIAAALDQLPSWGFRLPSAWHAGTLAYAPRAGIGIGAEANGPTSVDIIRDDATP